MKTDIDKLTEHVRALLHRVEASGCTRPTVRACGVLLAAALEPDANGELAEMRLKTARFAFFTLPDAAQMEVFNGWLPDPIIPDRIGLQAAMELAEVRRVLSIDATERTVMPALRFAMSDGDPLLRIEIREAATLEEVEASIGRIVGLLRAAWPALINHLRIGSIADQMAVKDLRRPEPATDQADAGKTT